MSLESDFALISNMPFKGRVTMAILVAAAAIKSEDPSMPNHAERLAWAESLTDFGKADQMAGFFMPNVVANPTISALGEASTDDDIKFTVNGLINQYALELFPQT